jgi:hypothetical protein
MPRGTGRCDRCADSHDRPQESSPWTHRCTLSRKDRSHREVESTQEQARRRETRIAVACASRSTRIRAWRPAGSNIRYLDSRLFSVDEPGKSSQHFPRFNPAVFWSRNVQITDS